MLSETEDNEGFYSGNFLPQRLAERAARVTDDPLQLSIDAFRSAEAIELCTIARLDLVRIRRTSSAAIARRDPLAGVQRFDP